MATTAAPQFDRNVLEFLRPPRKMLIDGKWVEAASGKTFETFSPATGEVLARLAEGNRANIDRAVRAARSSSANSSRCCSNRSDSFQNRRAR